MKHDTDAEGPSRNVKEAFTPAQDGDDGVDKADKIQARGNAQPKDAGFSHIDKGW
jgi:hypothetical protein